MQRLFQLLFVMILLTAGGCKGKELKRSVRVMTFNIRYDNPSDSSNSWPDRVGLVCDFLKKEKPDLLGLQEALWYQYEQIDSAISGYSSVARGRDDGKKKGEMNPVFYNVSRFEYKNDNKFWLSSTPSRAGSRSWGSSFPRIVTWVELTDKKTGKPLFYFNTHFAHDSDTARVRSAGLLLKEVKQIAGKNNFIITGDFNMSSETKAFSILTEKEQPKPFLKDAYSVSMAKPSGPAATFNGFLDKAGQERIDYIFVRNGMKVLSDSTMIVRQGPLFISDHWPVSATVVL
jgi:endonuclease/exonuclease/phosphatase family metal-dependent hydrolase